MQDIPQDVLIKASQGDLMCFEKIYKATASFVYNVAYRVLSNREDAEEVTQEVFVVLHRKLKDFRFESSLRTWIYRITVNRAINFARKTSMEKGKLMKFQKEMDVLGDASKAMALGEEENHETKIQGLLEGINPEQRACMVLRNIEGLSYHEIAQTLKVNINTVRTRLKRAREKLLSLRNNKEDHEQLSKI